MVASESSTLGNIRQLAKAQDKTVRRTQLEILLIVPPNTVPVTLRALEALASRVQELVCDIGYDAIFMQAPVCNNEPQ